MRFAIALPDRRDAIASAGARDTPRRHRS